MRRLAIARGLTGLLAGLALTGCGQRPCATAEEPGRDGALVSASFEGPSEAIETVTRHIGGVIIYQWFEVSTDCAVGGELSALDEDEDVAYPLLQSPDDPDLWGGWREQEARDERLWLDWTDAGDGCYGEDARCGAWPEGEHELLGPWLSAEAWYDEVWWPAMMGG